VRSLVVVIEFNESFQVRVFSHCAQARQQETF
jgi:hypothetical protein